MKENCAAATNNPWFDIEIEYADEIVQVIVTPKIFGIGVDGKVYKSVVMSRRNVIAPTLRRHGDPHVS